MRCSGSLWSLSCWSLLLVSFLSVSLAANAQIAMSTTSVNFGNVQMGSSGTVPVAVSNTGRSTLTISQAVASGTGFIFAGPSLPVTLSPQHSTSLNVTFSPQAAGSFSGSLNLTFSGSWGGKNKTHSSSTTIGLSGTGYTNSVATPGYLNAPSGLSLGSVLVGGSQTQSLALSNTGGSSLSISSASISGSSFTVQGLTFPYTLPAGASASLSVVFSPTVAGTTAGTLPLNSSASDPSVGVALSGTATAPGYLSAPSSMSLGNVLLGSNQTQPLTLTNTGGSSLSISSASISGSSFTVQGMTFPYPLPAGASASLSVVFSPTVAGTTAGTLTLNSSASDPSVGVALSGTATAPGYLSAPSSMRLGSVLLGSSQTQPLTLTNTGGSSLSISSASMSSSGFNVSGLTFPYNLAAGSSATLSVVFSPTVVGTASGTLSLSSNASDPSVTVA